MFGEYLEGLRRGEKIEDSGLLEYWVGRIQGNTQQVRNLRAALAEGCRVKVSQARGWANTDRENSFGSLAGRILRKYGEYATNLDQGLSVNFEGVRIPSTGK